MHLRIIGCSIVSTLVLVASSSYADGPNPSPTPETVVSGAETNERSESAKSLGRRGQLMMIGGADVDVRRTNLDYEDEGTAFGVAYGLDYFLSNHITAGVGVGAAHSSSRSEWMPLTASFSASTRLGYHVGLNDTLSLWPNVSPFYTTGKSQYVDMHGWGIGASIPVLVHLAPHVFAGAGPQVSVSWLTYDWGGPFKEPYDAVGYGFTSFVGGWI